MTYNNQTLVLEDLLTNSRLMVNQEYILDEIESNSDILSTNLIDSQPDRLTIGFEYEGEETIRDIASSLAYLLLSLDISSFSLTLNKFEAI